MRGTTYRWLAGVSAGAVLLAACSGADPNAAGSADQTTVAPATEEPATEPADEPAEPADEPAEPADEPAAEPDAEPEPGAVERFDWREPASGEPIVIGMVNTEGTPGLDFPEMRTDTDRAVAYLNLHGGMGGRPIQIEHCAAAGSPETSQACAQELVGKGVELVMLGLDLFPGYDTFTAAGVPVFGALPILPPDYTADAAFITGGNLTTMAAIAAAAVEHYQATSVGIISADNPGANGSEASLKAALDKAGIAYTSIKGGDNETDAGFQGLIREANSGDPDLLISLYSDAGCIGAMRGRVLLGIDTPAISTAICASAEVLDVVGDDADGWAFVGVGAPDDSAASLEFDAMIADESGDIPTSLGLGALGITVVSTLARIANVIAADGGAVTGVAIRERLLGSEDLRTFPNDTPLMCGAIASYPSVCSFEFPIGRYADGEIETIPGFESTSVVDYLP